MRQFRVSVSSESEKALDEFCEVTGASHSGVVDLLIKDFLGELVKRVMTLEKSEIKIEA